MPDSPIDQTPEDGPDTEHEPITPPADEPTAPWWPPHAHPFESDANPTPRSNG